jgi:hypothetical protein
VSRGTVVWVTDGVATREVRGMAVGFVEGIEMGKVGGPVALADAVPFPDRGAVIAAVAEAAGEDVAAACRGRSWA